MEPWAEKEKEEAKKRMRQKEEECDEIFKRSKLVREITKQECRERE